MSSFPFPSRTSQAKRRPALVVSQLGGEDLLLCQITSQTVRDRIAITIEDSDFQEGSLRQPSNVRPNRLFTADQGIVLYRVGHLKPDKLDAVIAAIITTLQK